MRFCIEWAYVCEVVTERVLRAFLCSDLPIKEHSVGSGWDFIMSAKIAAGCDRKTVHCCGLKWGGALCSSGILTVSPV